MRKVKKFKLTSEFIVDISGVKLFRIKALIEFGNVKAGDLGGYIEKEENLSHMGNARVYGDARVSGDKDYAYAHGFGSCNRTTTFFRLKDGDVGVRCGCFYGTLAQFRDNVCETHGETKKAQEYLMLADLMDFRFKN